MKTRRTLLALGTLLIASLILWIAPRDWTDEKIGGERAGTETNAANANATPAASSTKPETQDGLSHADNHGGSSSSHQSRVFGATERVTIDDIPESRFKEELLALEPWAELAALNSLSELGIPVHDIASLHVDRNGKLFYGCVHRIDPDDESTIAEAAIPKEDSIVTSLAETFSAATPSNAPPLRHSRPGAADTIYLDFTGHSVSGTAWNTRQDGLPVYECVPYNTDSNPAVFGIMEQAEIVMIWQRVAESFIGYDVNVTTEEPSDFDDRTAHVVLTSHRDADGNLNPLAGGASGVAFLNVFGNSDYSEKYAISFVYQFGRARGDIAATAVHELGHNMGLGHDGNSFQEYYGGHPAASGWWAPVMGNGPGTVQQWSRGEYYLANNHQDDLAIIGGKLALPPDDHADSFPGAMPVAANGAAIQAWGVIGRTSDVDVFTMTLGTGAVDILVKPNSIPFSVRENERELDVAVELRDSNDNLIGSGAASGSGEIVLQENITAGSYRLQVQGTGTGDPFAASPTGFTRYGSLGRYTITGTVTPPPGDVPPFIVTGPESQTVFEGNDATFRVVARGNPATTFQWQVAPEGTEAWIDLSDSSNVIGSGDPILTLRNVGIETGGLRYRCVASNVAGSASSSAATLTVNAAPRITSQPVSQYTSSGGSATFSVSVVGTAPLGFQWRKGGIDLQGATSATFSIASTVPGDSGAYSVRVTNRFGSAVSENATLGVDASPVIVAQPEAKGIPIGGSASISVLAVGTPLLNYQWLKDGAPITGATHDTLALTDVSSTDSGNYSVRVSNAHGAVVSASVSVVVGVAPSITTHPVSQTVLGGQSVGFSVIATGTSPLQYQWLRNGVDLAGATGATLALPGVTAESAGAYSVRVTNPIGSVTSEEAILAVHIPPSILSHPGPQIVPFGHDAIFTVFATGRPIPSLQWRKDGVDIPGAHSGTLLVSDVNIDDAGLYTAVATNAAGSIESNGAMLTTFEPVPVSGNRVAGGDEHSLFVTTDGKLWGMGSNIYGQLGDGTYTSRGVPVELAQDVSAVAAGRAHSLFIKADGTLWAMGQNGAGQLGDGTTERRNQPVLIATGVSRVAAGSDHSLFLKNDGTLWGMGLDSSGQLGRGGSGSSAQPVEIAAGVVALAAGSRHSLFVKADGTGWGMGYNSYGQLGIGYSSGGYAPVQIMTGLASVAAGDIHSLFLALDGTLSAAGSNGGGQLGDGTWDERRFPVVVASGVASIEAGGNSSSFIKSDGTLWVFGSSYKGQLGIGSTGTYSNVPVKVADGVVEAAMGLQHMLYIGIGDTVWVSGDNDDRQLGDGTNVNRDVAYRIRPPLPPAIVSQPSNAYGRAGSRASFEVFVDGVPPVAFQWAKDGLEIPGATDRKLTIDSVSPAVAGTYTVVATNSTGSVISESVTLSIIDELPLSRSTLAAGSDFTLILDGEGGLWGAGSGEKLQMGESFTSRTNTPRLLMDGVASISVNWDYSLIVKEDRTLWSTGGNTWGQLGIGHTSYAEPLHKVADDVVAASAGGQQSLFVKSDGTLWAMGAKEYLGLLYEFGPVQIDTGVVSAAAGRFHSLYLRVDGSLWAIGMNPWGQLGDGTRTARIDFPVKVATGVKAIAASEEHGLFLKTDGSLWAMGRNIEFQLGGGTTESDSIPMLVANEVVSLCTGRTQSFFIKTDGTLWGMGSNSRGQLGIGAPNRSTTPVLIASNVSEVASGDVHSVYRGTDGSLWVMGANFAGQLGDGQARDRNLPYRIDPPSPPVIRSQPAREFGAAGSKVVFRVKAEGGTALHYQWRKDGIAIAGANSSSLVIESVSASDFGSYSIVIVNEGGAVTSDSFEFVSLPPISTPQVRVALGTAHSLFLRGNDSLWAVGNTFSFSSEGPEVIESPVRLMTGVRAISAAGGHNLMIKTDGSLWAMGSNEDGQLGDGTRVHKATPVYIADSVALVSAGFRHSMFVKTDGTLWMMGSNASGQLGDGTYSPRLVPTQIATGVIAIAAGYDHSAFVRTDGSLWVMGSYYPPESLPPFADRSSPAQVASGVVEVAAGFTYTLFKKSDATLWAFGINGSAQFGSGTFTNSLDPVLAATDIATMAAGYFHSLILKTDGTLWASGSNSSGELGDGTNQTRFSPVLIASNVVAIDAGDSYSMYWKADGTLWAAGLNHYGQLGDGSRINRWVPVQTASTDELIISSQPVSKSVVGGQSTTLSVTVSASPAPTYQWLKDGVPIPGATSQTLTIVDANASDAGKYSVVVSNSSGSFTSSVASLFVTPDPSTSRMINISTRAFAGSAGDTLTVGFTIIGTGQKTLVIRGVGPKLADFNVPVVVADPKLRLFKTDGTLIAENDDWESVVAANAGGFSLPAGSKDAALEMQLPPGGYTVQLINPGPLAEGMIEVYDISQDAGSRLVNLSCRMNLEPGQIVIVGTALTGLARPVVVRNSGPGLAQYLTDPEKPNAASDPVLHSFDKDGMLVGQNDDWDAELAPYFSVIGAFPLGNGSKDASQRIMITPGLNTVHATAKGEGGIVLIELYESP